MNSHGSTIIASGTGIGYVVGNTGADVLVGDDLVQTIAGNGGADYLEARGGNDNLLGGDGNDHLDGGDGNDILQGDAGDDIALSEGGDDTVIAGIGDDFLHLGSGNDIAAAGDGNDYVLGGGGADSISGDGGNDSIDGGYGDDSLAGGAGDDLILGNLGNDSINGEDGSDRLFGAEDNDQLHGGSGNDFLDGGAGLDLLYGDDGNDLIVGGDDNDFADGGLGDDNILGGAGNDELLGGLDNDYLRGDDGDDTLSGGYGDDILVGGIGVNALDGGDGDDIYVVGADGNEHDDTITDSGGQDTLLLSWLSAADATGGLTLRKDGDDLVVAYNGRVLATITDQFVPGHAVETLELGAGAYIDLTAVTYSGDAGAFAVQAGDASSVAGEVAMRENLVDENLLSQDLYWNHTFLDKLSQLAYDEQQSDEAVFRYYDGTEVESFKRARGKFGGYYTVYKLKMPGNIDGTEFTGLQYAIQDSEDQTAAKPFGDDKTTLGGPYENFVNGAHVIYSTVGTKSIQDIVIDGAVVSTRVAGDSTDLCGGRHGPGHDL